MYADEWKIRIILSAFAVVVMLVPAVFFLCQSKEFASKIITPKNFWWYFPFIIFQIDAIITLIIRRKISAKH